MLKSGIEDAPEVNQALLGEFKIREDVKMRIRLPGYGDFRGFDFRGEADLSEIPKRVYEGFAKPPWPSLKHHILIAHIPKKLFKALSELRMQDNKGCYFGE